MPKSSTTRRTLDSSEWSGTEAHSIEYTYSRRLRHPAPYLRFVNGLDVAVTLDAFYTDDFDSGGNRERSPPFYTNSYTIGWPPLGGSPGGQSSSDTITLQPGEHASYSLQVSWDVFRIEVTPATAPSSGEFDVIDMK